MDTSFRKATASDVELALDILAGFKESSTKQWIKQTNREPARLYLLETVAGRTGASAFVVNDGMLLVLRPHILWETGALRLTEEVMMRIGPGGSLSNVIEVAEHFARKIGATSVVFGTAFSDRDAALSAAYQRHGYREEARLLYKEIT